MRELHVVIPLAEFECLHEQLRDLEQKVKELETIVRGYEWGMSNAMAEEHAITNPDA